MAHTDHQDSPVTGEFGVRIGALWDALPDALGETLTLEHLDWPAEVENRHK